MSDITPNQEPQFSTLTGADETVAVSGYGQILSQARQAKGLTVEQVASQLRLSPKQITQMENQDTSAFPTPVYVRAHVRSYSRLLGLNEEKVVAEFNKTLGIEEKDPTKRIARVTEDLAPKKPEGNAPRGRSLVWIFFLALLCGVGYVGYYYYQNYQHDQMVKQQEAEAAIQAEKDRLAAEEKKRAEEAAQAELEKAAAQQKAEEEVRLRKEEEAKAAEAANSRYTVSIDEQHGAVLMVPKADATEARLSFSIPAQGGRSWIGVYNDSGRFVMNKTLSAGTVEQVSAPLPLRVTFGNASAVDVTLNDHPIDFKDVLAKSGSRHFIIRAQE